MWVLLFCLFPLVSAGMWLATILTLLIRWAVDDFPDYPSMEPGQSIAYISDVGAMGLKPLFITGSAITSVFFTFSFLVDRWLRHKGRLLPNKGWLDKSLAILAIIFAVMGTVGLILLSIFDTVRYTRQHNGLLVLFMGGYLLSAIFVCLEYLRLGIHYRGHRILAVSFCVKLLFIIVELALAIAFGVCTRGTRKNQAAVLEWVIALIFTFYILSFVIDLLPSVRRRHQPPQGKPEAPMAERDSRATYTASSGNSAFANHQQQQRYSANTYRGQTVAGGAAPGWTGGDPGAGYASAPGQETGIAAQERV